MYNARHIVNLKQCACTCGRWQLNAIPCSHTCAAIYIHKQKTEVYLDGYYMIDKYMQGYAARVFGLECPNTWLSGDPYNAILPPVIRRAPGRPKIPGKPKIARRRVAVEPPNPYKLTHSGYVMKCGNCGASDMISKVFSYLSIQTRKGGNQRNISQKNMLAKHR
jgi:hypothetical protein